MKIKAGKDNTDRRGKTIRNKIEASGKKWQKCRAENSRTNGGKEVKT